MVRHTFFKWIGGKEWLWKLIKPHLISDDHEIYIEPFLGGGAIAIHLLKWCRKHNVHKKFILSDTNPGLINAYIQIRDNFDNLTTYLNELDSMESTKSLYYERRKEYNLKSKDSIESAGLFIWLLANGLTYCTHYRASRFVWGSKTNRLRRFLICVCTFSVQ